MGTYKTNWKLTETVMPEDFNRIEENIKENNKNHNDFKNEYDKNLKEQNKKIDNKPEKSDVVLKTPKRLLVTTDLNTVVEGGNYIVEQNTPNSPVGYGRLVVYQWDSPSKWITQVFYSDVTNEVYTRCSTNTEATSWTPWKKLISTSEADNKYLSKNLGIVSDFNNCKTPGIYTITGVDIPNAPFGGSMYGTLEVIPRGSDLIQRVSTSSGAMFFRYYASDGYNVGFRGWNKVYTDSTAPKWTEIREKPNLFTQSQSDDRYFRTYIEEVSDFNTCLHEGKYIVSSSKALPNSPISSDVYGELLVLTRGDSGELHQIYFDYRTKIFTRFKSNGSGWSAWAQTYSTINKPNWNDVVNKPDLDSKYFLNYRDSVIDFNNCKAPGNYYVSKANIPNAPYTSINPLYGTLMVSKTFDDYTQIFVDRFANIYTRYYNNANKTWTNWVKTINSNEMETPSYSEELSTNSSNIIEVGKGQVYFGDGYRTKDYRNSMKRGMVTIDNVIGRTGSKNRKLWNVSLDNIASYDPSTEVNIFTKQPKNILNCSHTLDTSLQKLTVRSTDTSYGYVQFELDVKSNTTYMIVTDFIEDDGNAFVAVANTPDGDSTTVLSDITYLRNNSAIFTTFSDTHKVYVRFYANVDNPLSGLDVTYKNAKLVEAKDYVQNSGIKLRSLPNGVHDELVNGKKVIRIKSYTLNGSENWELIDQRMTNTNAFVCKLPDSINTPDKRQICLNTSAYEAVSDDTLYNNDKICLAMGGINGQLVFRVGKWCTTAEQLVDHLANKETDITIEYEITKRTMEKESKNCEVNTSLLCESGDKILIGSPMEITESTHRVPLNLKAQMDNLQDHVAKSKRSVWSRLKDLLNVEYESTDNYGYIKFPKIFGGFIFQWGCVEMGTSNYNFLIKDTFYPINFPQTCYYTGMGYMRSNNSWQDLSGNAVATGDNGTTGIRLHVRNTTGNQLTGSISTSWFAIGK
ncbi:MAG: pyocin knob domain-containing protein [Paraclostridium sordellii]